MSLLKAKIQSLLRVFGLQVIRASRSLPVQALTEVRNVLNSPLASRRAAFEPLGRASLSVHLDWLLKRWSIDCVLDVGANLGGFAGEVRALGYRGHIASFEPMAGCARTLRGLAAQDGAWTVFPCDLASASGTQELMHFADATFSARHTINADAREEFGLPVETTGSETVTLRRLDDVSAEAVGDRQRVLLKVDTQGHDLEVLRGGPLHLPDCMAVLCEASFAPIYDATPSCRAVFAFLGEQVFECAGLHALSSRKKLPALIEANALFVSRAWAERCPPWTP